MIVSLTALSVGIFMSKPPKPICEQLKLGKESPYDQLWQKVDSLGNKGLTRSALDVVALIYDKAKTENNAPNIVKAVIHRLKFESYITDEDYVNTIADLDKEIETSVYPAKPVLHSVQAEIYWRYYQANRYKFLNRTETVDFKQEDVRTWDLRKIVDQVIKHYMASLTDADSLKKTPLSIYDNILTTQSESKNFRPTLYDFLAHRAVDFFMNTESGLTAPVNRFEMNNPELLAPYSTFVDEKIVSEDKYSLKYYALAILQDLLKFHSNDSNPQALIDAELKRLRFVHAQSVLEDKDSLYVKALYSDEAAFIANPASTEITFDIASYYSGKASSFSAGINEETKWYFKKAYAICDGAIKRFPDAFGSKNCVYLQKQIMLQSVNALAEQTNVPNKPFRALVTYKNTNQVSMRVCKTNPEWFKKITRKYYGQELMDQLAKLRVQKQWVVNVPDDGDHHPHSAEFRMPELEPGFYTLLLSPDGNFDCVKGTVSYFNVWISNLAYTNRTLSDGEIEFVVFNRVTGEPLKNVGAQVYREHYSYVTRDYEYRRGAYYNSDADGRFIVPAIEDNYDNFFIELEKGNDVLHTDYYYQYKPYQVPIEYKNKTIFFTDRAIYRPGQTIYFKGIFMETDGENSRIKPGAKTTVTLYDVNSQIVSSLELTANEYGTFDGSFVAPSGVLNGQMSIRNDYGNVYFSVEEYKRPKFEVKIDPVKGSYRLNDNITIKGNAISYAGSNIDNANVKYRIVRTASFEYWWWRWYGYYPNSPQMEIANGSTTTSETGEFTINFKALPDLAVTKASDPTFTYNIYADVTDLNGETRSGSISFSAGYKALMVNVNLPSEIEKSNKDKFVINTTNRSGIYEYASGNISVYRIKEPSRLLRKRAWSKPDQYVINRQDYMKDFPLDVYENEDNMAKREKAERVLDLNFDTKKDSLLSLENIADWAEGQYVLEVKSKDKYGAAVEWFTYFTVFSKDSKNIPVNEFDWFTVLKAKGEPGETASFLIGTKDTAVKVLYEIEHKDKITERKWITLKNEMKKIDIPITEDMRGNFAVHFTFIRQNRVYNHDVLIEVPYTNKQLDIVFETFRNKLLPGQKEEWKLKINGSKGEKVMAEMLASMYDASLDAFKTSAWPFDLWKHYYMSRSWEAYHAFSTSQSTYNYCYYDYNYLLYHYYDALNWFGFENYGYRYDYYSYNGYLDDSKDLDNYVIDGEVAVAQTVVRGARATAKAEEKEGQKKERNFEDLPMGGASGGKPDETPGNIDRREAGTNSRTGEGSGGGAGEGVKTRTNFNETAFFYPHLETDANGEIIISFTIPDALTRWKFRGIAHTKDLQTGYIEKEIITQKNLMVVPNPPRFFREGDKITFASKVTNLSEEVICGEAQLMLFDALTMKPLDVQMGNLKPTVQFDIPRGQSKAVEWDIVIPEGLEAVIYKVVAKAGNHSDGEEMAIPVVTNRMLVTETFPLPVRGKQIKEFIFSKLANSGGSSTLKNHKLTFEFTSNPAWYAVQALPYLIEYPYECAEQLYSRFYANAIASYIANSHPRIKSVFESWKNTTPDALLSNLEKNQELKSALLQETPWVLDAKDESQNKRNVGILFDMNRMSNELETALSKLEKMQVSNGGWPWFPGMPDDRYITQYIITGMGHLDKLGVRDVKDNQKVWKMCRRGVLYLDDRIREDYEYLLKYYPDEMELNHLYALQIQYLYARSYFIGSINVENKNQKAFNYYKGQAHKYWLQNNHYLQGMIALALNRLDDKAAASDITKSLKENAIYSEEMGMYWKDMDEGWYWYQAPIETQALLIECFDEVANDQKTVEELKVWLLKQKQTQNWKTTKATAEACYALLLRGTDWLAKEPDVEIMIGNMIVDPKKMPDVKVEAGTGYFKTAWWGADITPLMGNIKISKKDDGVCWGALYWQYFEQLDKITPSATPLNLEKKLFVERPSAYGPVIEPITEQIKLKLGDKIKVRIEIRVDRDMEYVHMKDMRASGFEPVNVISRYKYQGGLGYYESTGDLATNFFISWLPKGTYVFEYPLRVAQKGDFSNGITSIQCMYAPEYSSHTEGIRVRVTG